MAAFSVCGSAIGGDSERIAYLAREGPYWQVWTANPDGGAAAAVTRSPYEKAGVSWFPDGRHLLVNALDGRLFRVNRETGEEALIEIPLSGTHDAVMAPDGRHIAFSYSAAGSRDDNEIWLVNPDGSALRRLTRWNGLQHQPAWEPTGRWIYFLSGDGGQTHDVWRVSLETGSREQITVGSLYHFELDVAPDGRLAFSSNRSGNYEIYSQRDGEAPKQWTDHPALDGGPTWAPDGRSLIFHSTRSGTQSLWRLDAPGGAPSQLKQQDFATRDPAWWRPPGTRE